MTAQVLETMGTRLEFLLPGCDAPELWARVRDEVVRLDSVFNRFSASSDVSKYNAGGKASAELEDAMRLCECYRTLTCGLFDIRKGGVQDSRLGQDSGSAQDFRPGGDLGVGVSRALDFGGFAKGFALRKVALMLRRAGIEDAFVSFGGSSILALGHHPCGESWKVAVEDPYTGLKIEECPLSGMALSVSGNTPHYTGHIIDPRTGKGNFERKMSSALCPDPLDAEILSTVVMIADENQIETLEKNFPSAELKLYLL